MLRYILPLILFFVSSSAWAQLEINATIDHNQIAIDDDVSITVQVSGKLNAPDPVVPQVPGLQINKSGRSSSIQIVNGKMSIAAEHIYTVIPTKKGEYSIPPFHVFAGGREYKSNGLKLSVTDAVVTQRQFPPGQQPYKPGYQKSLEGDPKFWIETKVTKGEPYRSEQILYQFKLYTRENITQAAPILPNFDDFLTEIVVKDRRGSEVVNGRSYATWEKVIALIPLKEGKLTIPPAEIDIVYQVIDANRRNRNRWDPFFNNSLFNSAFARTEKASLKSKAINLTVKSLPEPKPQNFTGLVGKFGAQAKLSQDEVKQGESITLEVSLSGQGNVKEADIPKMNFPGFKVYYDKPTTDVYPSEQGLSGQKRFKMALVPQKEGDLKVPGFDLKYFDPVSGKYEDMVVLEQNIKVLPGDQTQQQTNTVLAQGNQNLSTQIEYQDIAPIYPDARDVLGSQSWAVPRVAFYSVFYGFPFAVLIFGIGRKIGGRARRGKGKADKKLAYKSLIQDLSNPKITEDKVLDGVRGYLSAVFEVPGKGLTADEMQDLLKRNKLNDQLSARLGKAISELEAVQYGFDKDAALGSVTKELKKIVQEINKVA